ncbi:type IV secretion system protein TrbL [Selenomonas ruminantium]|uniref:Type IV secretion system protein TrbL n=1 Tax=Selenomonas ruminantium TaxID=971 RepID=A0A1I3H7T0_SELRU|nr:P-type conjugative transfer protein TrbL [Selenomonas ruminantium]SFI31818.1 type IV secretion system protein TrbL [Selenomonas ruminantium]
MELAVFDQICYQFETIATGGVPQIKALVMATFWMLATIDACMAFLTNLDDGDHFKIMIQKCLKIGFWLFLLNNWGMFCSIIKNSFIMAGSVIGSGGGMGIMQHPSVIVAQGITTLEPILTFEKNFTGMTEVLSNLPMLLAGIIAYVFGCLAYVILGVQVVLTYVEFYLVCALLTVFVPFGVTKWTSFLAEKAIGGVIAYGVKLMVMSCLVAIIPDVLNSYAPLMEMNPDNALTVMVSLVTVAILLAFLAWQAPALAASVMTGGPSLTAGSAAGFGAGVAMVAAGAGMAASKGASAIAGSGSAGSSSGKSSAATAASQTNNNTSNTDINNSSSSSVVGSSSQASPTFSSGGTTSYGGSSSSGGSSSGGSGSSASGDGSSASGGSSSSSSNSAGGSSSTGGSSKGASGSAGAGGSTGSDGGAASGNASGSSDTSAGGATGGTSSPADSGSSGSSNGGASANAPGNNAASSAKKSPAFSEAVTKMSMMRSAIPQEASPKGGMSAPIRD